MWKKFVTFSSLAFLLAVNAEAASNDCTKITDKEARLACFDKASEPQKDGASGSAVEEEEKTANTAEVVKAKPSDPAKRIDADDLAIAPNKYVGKNLEITKAQCFYADKDEYRCITTASAAILMLQAPDITPLEEKERIESDCGEIKKMPTVSCRRTLRFSPVVVEHDTVGLRDRTVVTAKAFEIVPGSPKRKKR